MLDLGEVQLAIDLVQDVLLDDLVHDNGNQQVEEDGGDVLEAGVVEDQFVGTLRTHVDGHGDVVVQRDEEGGEGRRHLEHEPDDEDHGDAGDDISMVLDDELMAEDRGVLGVGPSLDSHGGFLVSQRKTVLNLSLKQKGYSFPFEVSRTTIWFVVFGK